MLAKFCDMALLISLDDPWILRLRAVCRFSVHAHLSRGQRCHFPRVFSSASRMTRLPPMYPFSWSCGFVKSTPEDALTRQHLRYGMIQSMGNLVCRIRIVR